MLCRVCGNEIEEIPTFCPHCRIEKPVEPPLWTGPVHRLVNLEKGRPMVRQALARMDMELKIAASQGFKVLTLIHGYGSSGAGGAIKAAVRHQLDFFRHQGKIQEVVYGEEFEGRSGRGRQLLRRFPVLAAHRDLNRGNPGITLVILLNP
ncbi:hypothetical protein [Desulfobulbus alkaliphilus]|uniref:hypothetical protein n=1 Tax=Desulfobulbus alkaliphilus TaxID=869814 RepID=UPI00196534C1|nr:hypothetical protein [Desulfobulbus alkaliphilus]MBM9535867.1 hypothetical protein [Desulfobulbus alkaliphilus]